jgi:hypothetical protein
MSLFIEQKSARHKTADQDADRPLSRGSWNLARALSRRCYTADRSERPGHLHRYRGGADRDERYFTLPIVPRLTKDGRPLSIGIHKGFIISLVANAFLWAGIIAAVHRLIR